MAKLPTPKDAGDFIMSLFQDEKKRPGERLPMVWLEDQLQKDPRFRANDFGDGIEYLKALGHFAESNGFLVLTQNGFDTPTVHTPSTPKVIADFAVKETPSSIIRLDGVRRGDTGEMHMAKDSGSQKPRLFVGSAVNNLIWARAVQAELDHDCHPTVWTQGVFRPNLAALQSLLIQLDKSDFGVFIFAPSDVTVVKGQKRETVRDNVVFEFGLFLGALGPTRAFFMVPRGFEKLHILSDLAGIEPLTYASDRPEDEAQATLGAACSKVRAAMENLGRRKKANSSGNSQSEPETTPSSQSDLVGFAPSAQGAFSTVAKFLDPNTLKTSGDIANAIEAWLIATDRNGAYSDGKLLRYVEVDEKLKLFPGSAKTHLARVAKDIGLAGKAAEETFMIEPNGW